MTLDWPRFGKEWCHRSSYWGTKSYFFQQKPLYYKRRVNSKYQSKGWTYILHLLAFVKIGLFNVFFWQRKAEFGKLMKNVRDSGLSRKRDENAGSGPPLPDPDSSLPICIDIDFKTLRICYSLWIQKYLVLLNSQAKGKKNPVDLFLWSCPNYCQRAFGMAGKKNGVWTIFSIINEPIILLSHFCS